VVKLFNNQQQLLGCCRFYVQWIWNIR